MSNLLDDNYSETSVLSYKGKGAHGVSVCLSDDQRYQEFMLQCVHRYEIRKSLTAS